jgi:hypothetical protein
MPIAAAMIAQAVKTTQTLPILRPPSGASGILRSPKYGYAMATAWTDKKLLLPQVTTTVATKSPANGTAMSSSTMASFLDHR